ncbi:unnamed protein product [Caretta caretta]
MKNLGEDAFNRICGGETGPALSAFQRNNKISILRDNNRMCLGEESQGGEFLIEFRTCKLRFSGAVVQRIADQPSD